MFSNGGYQVTEVNTFLLPPSLSPQGAADLRQGQLCTQKKAQHLFLRKYF